MLHINTVSAAGVPSMRVMSRSKGSPPASRSFVSMLLRWSIAGDLITFLSLVWVNWTVDEDYVKPSADVGAVIT
ncbi:hypothetical protein OOZ19_04375 [Saccharopolyspora sp. NFXS83]|uniref:hypothetical protein n=1 Tax=Saccharopolyspora sp. NFXS83 TaxID=2993560 RepID=UPI00224A6F87|nr:hypothetical protein [Saccharopolyspora sp. NFXS83]MCX2729464.1 hypothetical protein [Saccharopolyspora sp. NFXS83]